MFYDAKNKIIIDELPKNSIGPDGKLYIDFNLSNDINLWANHQYYTIRNDMESPGSDYLEDSSKRTIILDYPYADITRLWKLERLEE